MEWRSEALSTVVSAAVTAALRVALPQPLSPPPGEWHEAAAAPVPSARPRPRALPTESPQPKARPRPSGTPPRAHLAIEDAVDAPEAARRNRWMRTTAPEAAASASRSSPVATGIGLAEGLAGHSEEAQVMVFAERKQPGISAGVPLSGATAASLGLNSEETDEADWEELKRPRRLVMAFDLDAGDVEEAWLSDEWARWFHDADDGAHVGGVEAAPGDNELKEEQESDIVKDDVLEDFVEQGVEEFFEGLDVASSSDGLNKFGDKIYFKTGLDKQVPESIESGDNFGSAMAACSHHTYVDERGREDQRPNPLEAASARSIKGEADGFLRPQPDVKDERGEEKLEDLVKVLEDGDGDYSGVESKSFEKIVDWEALREVNAAAFGRKELAQGQRLAADRLCADVVVQGAAAATAPGGRRRRKRYVEVVMGVDDDSDSMFLPVPRSYADVVKTSMDSNEFEGVRLRLESSGLRLGDDSVKALVKYFKDGGNWDTFFQWAYETRVGADTELVVKTMEL
ncbi:unnamed protein product [Prorocentrum cordatum]|uniref:Uncharacterized protein n=1 Tax=Prorocentrum cordatum TaxID=2364126 RepID=A0ABN9XUY4_9DINO|nr:unnamed protein product [Polarella glacialis]